MALQPPGRQLSSRRQRSARSPPEPRGPPGRRGRRILPGSARSLPSRRCRDAGRSLPEGPRRGLPLPTHPRGGVYTPLSRQVGQPRAGGDDISTFGSYAYLRHTWRKSTVIEWELLPPSPPPPPTVCSSLEFPLGPTRFDIRFPPPPPRPEGHHLYYPVTGLMKRLQLGGNQERYASGVVKT